MRIIKEYRDELVDDHFPNMVEIRTGNECKVWAAGTEEYLLILFDSNNWRVTVYECDTPTERQEYINLARRLRGDDGDTGAGVPAVLGPVPPSRTAFNAEPLPRLEQEEDYP